MTTATGLIEFYWEVIWNQRATERLGEVFHEPYLHNRSEATLADHAAIVAETVRAIPDLRIEIVDITAAGAVVITRTRFTGRHGGDLFGVGPTGRALSAPGLDVYFLRDGRVERLWHLFDHLPLLRGMGAVATVDGRPADLE